MNRVMRRTMERTGIRSLCDKAGLKVEAITAKTITNLAVNDFNLARFVRYELSGQAGGVSIETIIMIFVAIIILYQLIPQISNANSMVQASTNATTMAKFAAGLGEWMFPLLGIVAVVFLLFKRRKNSGV
jgi:hypothetical protein